MALSAAALLMTGTICLADKLSLTELTGKRAILIVSSDMNPELELIAAVVLAEVAARKLFHRLLQVSSSLVSPKIGVDGENFTAKGALVLGDVWSVTQFTVQI